MEKQGSEETVMNRRKIVASVTAVFLVAGSIPPVQIHAEDFSDEEYWIKKCSAVQPTQEDADLCTQFKNAYASRQQEVCLLYTSRCV